MQADKVYIRPLLEHASSACGPHREYLKDKLENICITSDYPYEP